MLSKIKHACSHCTIGNLHVRYPIFPRVNIYIFLSFLLIQGGFVVVLGLVSLIGFSYGWAFQLMGIGACGVRGSQFFLG